MFRSKTIISLCILLGAGLGCFHAHAYWIAHVRYWEFSKVISGSENTICFWMIFGSALSAALIASWKERTSLWLALSGITVGWMFAACTGPMFRFKKGEYLDLLPADIVWEQLSRQALGMLLGAFLFLYWPEIGRFLNSLNGKHSDALTAPRSPSESHGSS